MRLKVFLFTIVVVAVLLSGCGGTGNSVDKVTLNHLSMVLKDSSNDPGDGTAYRHMFVELDNSARWDEITEIRLTDPNGIYWNYTKSSSPSLADNWDSTDRAFEFYNLYSSSYADAIPLGDYMLEMTTGGLGTVTYTFEVSSLTGQNFGSIYTQTGTGGSSQILDIASNVTASLDTDDNLTVDFDSVDTAVEDGYLWLFDSTDDTSYLGSIGYFSDKHPLSKSTSNSYTFSVSEASNQPKSLYTVLIATKEVNSQFRLYYRTVSPLTSIIVQ